MHDSIPFAPAPGLIQTLRPRKVALFRASRIGDFICATPAFRALRAALPGAEITFVGLPLVADLAARCPSFDRFEPFPGMPGVAEQFFDARRSLEFLARMQSERFDLAVQMHGSGVYSNPIVLLFGARVTAGFVRPGDPSGPLHAFPLPAELPEIERLLALAAFLGAPPAGDRTEFPLRGEDRAAAAKVLAQLPQPFVGIHAGAREATKRWPAERFADAAGAILQQRAGSVVILGGPDEAALGCLIAGAIRAPHVDLTGHLSLPVLGGVIERLAVLITNDSGPAHIGYALNTPTVTVFGGTDPARWRPLVPGPFRLLAHAVACRPCEYAECPLEKPCLEFVEVDEVVRAAKDVMRA